MLVVDTAFCLLTLHGLLPLCLRALCLLCLLPLRLLLPGLLCLSLALGLLRALRVVAGLVLPGIRLLSALPVLGAGLVVALFLVVAPAMVVLCARGAHAKRQRGCECKRPQGLLAGGEFHVGTFSACQRIGWPGAYFPRAR